MIDYIIVGSGLAGIAFAETALQNNKSVFVFDNQSHNSSSVAAGLYNPVILKRFSGLQFALEHLEIMNQLYDGIEQKLNRQFRFPMPLLRRFASVEEQNNWFQASDNPLMKPFLSTNLKSEQFAGLSSPFGFGEVNHTGYVSTKELLVSYRSFLQEIESYSNEMFDYDVLQLNASHVTYKTISARHIVFAEGFGIHANPFFRYLPLNGTKGELLIIHASDLKLDQLVNAGVFFIPLGNGFFKVGATYNWSDKTETISDEGKVELVKRISEVLECDFKVVEQFAGVRPTTRDRKPIIGKNARFHNMYVLNGLGTRGVMLAPAMAKHLYDLIETGEPLPKDIDIARFSDSYPSQDGI